MLFIEATLLPGGNQNIILTGQLGNVMQESARAALSHIRARAERAGDCPPDFLAKHDLHVHVPAGAIPKDGPSAGVTMATAILSAARNQPVRQDVAMTGEITLSGLVLPVGGIREKALAARRLGIKTVILPALNEPDLAELPEEIRRDMTFVPVENARAGHQGRHGRRRDVVVRISRISHGRCVVAAIQQRSRFNVARTDAAGTGLHGLYQLNLYRV